MLKNIRFKITHKILLLVGMLSTFAILSTLYSLNNMYMVDKNYRNLLEHKTQNTLIIADALLDLSDASRLAFSVLTEQDEQTMRDSHQLLVSEQTAFVQKLNSIHTLSQQQKVTLTQITGQQSDVFSLINEVIEQAARWRGDPGPARLFNTAYITKQGSGNFSNKAV